MSLFPTRILGNIMLDKFAKLEEILNKALEKLILLLKALFFKLVPTKFLNQWKRFNHFVKKNLYIVKATFLNFFIKLALSIKDIGTHIKLLKKALSAKKEMAKEKLGSVKVFLLNSPLKTTINHISPMTKMVKQKLSQIFSKERMPQFVLAGSALTMITLGIIAIAQQTHHIYRSENPYRKPASIQTYDEKPEYYYYKQQTTMVQNIKVPLQVDSVAQMDSLTIDFSVRTSTRYASYFLKENEHKLKDYFFTNVQPIVSDFALDEEGKEVLKEKIQNEIQNFLDKEGVEGEVLEINLQYVIGS